MAGALAAMCLALTTSPILSTPASASTQQPFAPSARQPFAPSARQPFAPSARQPFAPSARCDTGGAFAFGVGIDCIIDLDPENPNPDTADLYSAGLIDQNGEYWPCDIDDALLRCRNIGRDRYDLATRQLDLELNHEIEGLVQINDVVTIETFLDEQQQLFFFVDTFEPVVFEGRPLPIELFTTTEIERAFIVVRERDTGRLIDRIEVGAPGRDRSVSAHIDIPAAPGRYRIWPCIGADEDTCEELPAGYPVQLIDPELRELVPGHNRPSAERINMVFAGSELGGADELVSMAMAMLTMEGAQAGEFDFVYGPMAIEPLASNQHRFNFWYLAAPLADERSLLVDGTDPLATQGFELDNMAVTVLYGPGYGPSDARLTSLWNQVNAPEAEQIRFGGVRVSVDIDDPLARATTLAHEWGHSLFELRDEYVGFDQRAVLTQYPNCAPSLELANDWWGSLDGKIDPFVYEVLRARRAAGFPGEPSEGRNLATSVQVGEFPGGCYDTEDATTAYRPSLDSLMNSEVPVFGSVNRRRVEQVLSRFSGRGPLDDLDAIDVGCERRGGVVRCGGHLDRYLDPPERRIALDNNSCELASPIDSSSPTETGRSTISCATASPSGPVVLALGDQRRTVAVINMPEPIVEPPPAVDDRPEPVGEPGSDRATGLLVAAAVLGGFVLVGTSWAAWRRQK